MFKMFYISTSIQAVLTILQSNETTQDSFYYKVHLWNQQIQMYRSLFFDFTVNTNSQKKNNCDTKKRYLYNQYNRKEAFEKRSCVAAKICNQSQTPHTSISNPSKPAIPCLQLSIIVLLTSDEIFLVTNQRNGKIHCSSNIR